MVERGVGRGVQSGSAHVEEGETRGSGHEWRAVERSLRPAQQRWVRAAAGDVEPGKIGGGGGWHVGRLRGGAQL
jgi:hypothetical protein